MRKEFYTAKEASEVLGVKPLTIYRWIDANKLHALRFGRTVRIHESEITRYKNEEDNEVIERGLTYAVEGVH